MSAFDEGAAALLIAGVLVAPPLVVVWWSARALVEWRGGWRVLPLLPLLPIAASVTPLVEGAALDPMGHSGWYFLLPASGLLGLALARTLDAVHARFAAAGTRAAG